MFIAIASRAASKRMLNCHSAECWPLPETAPLNAGSSRARANAKRKRERGGGVVVRVRRGRGGEGREQHWCRPTGCDPEGGVTPTGPVLTAANRAAGENLNLDRGRELRV